MTKPNERYELVFEERPSYLVAHVNASTIDEQIAMAYLGEIANKCDEIECERLLFIREIPEMLPDGALFFVSADFQKMINGIKTAFVNPFAKNTDSFDFAITVAENRGANYHLFDSIPEAEKWLLEDVST